VRPSENDKKENQLFREDQEGEKKNGGGKRYLFMEGRGTGLVSIGNGKKERRITADVSKKKGKGINPQCLAGEKSRPGASRKAEI